VIDLFADAPVGNPKASTHLLAPYAQWFLAKTVFLCVVDPGVGGTRPPIIVEADGRWWATVCSSWFSAMNAGRAGRPN
jgi:S-adenosyl-L-methionine hydrolase (adenosine-forming)